MRIVEEGQQIKKRNRKRRIEESREEKEKNKTHQWTLTVTK